MNAHVLDVRVAALLAFYAAKLEQAEHRDPQGFTPIRVGPIMRYETLQLAREVLATVPREHELAPSWNTGRPQTSNGWVA